MIDPLDIVFVTEPPSQPSEPETVDGYIVKRDFGLLQFFVKKYKRAKPKLVFSIDEKALTEFLAGNKK